MIIFGITHTYVGYLIDTGTSSALLRYNFSDHDIQLNKIPRDFHLVVVVKNTIFRNTYGKRSNLLTVFGFCHRKYFFSRVRYIDISVLSQIPWITWGFNSSKEMEKIRLRKTVHLRYLHFANHEKTTISKAQSDLTYFNCCISRYDEVSKLV